MAKLVTRINNLTMFFDGLRQRLKERKKVYVEKKTWNFCNIENHFCSYPANDLSIDNATWDDLDMDEVFKAIDYNETTCGQQVLYDWMRRPLYDLDGLRKREEMITFFKENKSKREEVIKLLSYVGHMDYDIHNLLDGHMPELKGFYLKTILFPILLIILGSIFIFTMSSFALIGIILLLITNAIIHSRIDLIQSGYLTSIYYLAKIIDASGKVAKIFEEDFEGVSSDLKACYKKCLRIRKKAQIPLMLERSKYMSLARLAFDWLDYVLLIRARNALRLMKIINNKAEASKKLYTMLGEIDCCQSVSKLRLEMKRHCIPTLVDKPGVLKAQGVYTPLLDSPVRNDIDLIEKGMMLTGSNMSGKSTFLRAVGQNVILAQSIHTCMAKSYAGSFYHVKSSIRICDDITRGASYYFSEAKRIQEIIKSSDRDISTLIIIDEMLRGTNDTERRHICIEALNMLIDHNCKLLFATHDTGIAPVLSGYAFRYFTSSVIDGDLHFDYKLHPGVCPDGNAVDVIEYLGYPKELVQRIRKRIKF